MKQILGHLDRFYFITTPQSCPSAVPTSPLSFPNYATFGNNDRWIAIQNYQNEDLEQHDPTLEIFPHAFLPCDK